MSKLKDYYKKLKNKTVESPKKAFIRKAMKECDVKSEQTIYRWISGEVKPDKLRQEKLSKLTGIPVDELFKASEK